MGYGTTLAPLLLLMGFNPLAVVPAILLSELITGALAAFMHHRAGNVQFDFSNDKEHYMRKRLGRLGYIPKSFDSKIAMVLAICSFLGAVVAVFVAISLPKFYLKLFIGLIVSAMGVIILSRYRAKPKFSWNKIVGLGVVAAFNKGLSGGGYGPLVTSGQILSGVKSKASVAITSLAESFTCLVGISVYFLLGTAVDWSIAPYLALGAVLSVPFSTFAVRRISLGKLTLVVGIATLLLGLYTLCSLFA
ncbi:MAG: sulfite exporter TauE/SafE family protein [Candidatus Diapherotrites archaeon]|uniref:Probable membrane transporter protein n=1 Tax=Candidatus Iainarchaeum sp. TaxID=3101447 RepID=A0A938YRL9_9ARCH|nr:sulfite exporter TauE/SafE family protein [Candidatus Diapherotrites archaeon]